LCFLLVAKLLISAYSSEMVILATQAKRHAEKENVLLGDGQLIL